MDLSPASRQALVDVASDVICRRLGGVPARVSLPDDPLLKQPAGCFVSLHRRENHQLRGCIGVLDTGQPLADVVVSAAESVLGDPRFLAQPVSRQEIPLLDIEVTVLGPMRVAASPLDFEPKEVGIYLTVLGRSGLFLPQVARETGWTREQLLARLCLEKIGVAENSWRHPSAQLRTFTADVIGPQPMTMPSAEECFTSRS